MRLTIFVTCLLLAAAARGEFDNTRNLLKTKNNASLKKRAPASSAVGSPVNAGVEYADTKQQLADKSPSQRVYATPAPQLAKFSDLVAGAGAAQAPSYHSAIASQLFAPVSVYQPRTGTPTTYEVSAPVPSQLAYSEHRLAYQQPNTLQYSPQVSRHPEITQQQILAQTQQIFNQQPLQQAYQQPLQQAYQQPLQQAYQQPLQQAYQQFPQAIQAQAQPLTFNQLPPVQYKQLESQPALQALQYQQAPKAFYSDQQNLLANQYNLAPQQLYTDGQQFQQQYIEQQPVQNVQYSQPGVSYTRQEESQPKVFSQPEQNRVFERQQYVAQNYQTQPQGPVSFAKVSQDQSQSIIHHPFHQQSVPQQSPVAQGSSGHEHLSYFRPGPQLQLQPQVVQSQAQQSHQAPLQVQYSKPNPGYKSQSVAAAPAFPPVQYFGKYAQSIFGKNQQ